MFDLTQKKAKVPFQDMFPTANSEAIDLLDRMLVFDPTKRIPVEFALLHPYFDSVRSQYLEPEPVCQRYSSASLSSLRFVATNRNCLLCAVVLGLPHALSFCTGRSMWVPLIVAVGTPCSI